MHEDEEVYIPDNVITEFRIWIMGPKHLKRAAWSPVIALALVLLAVLLRVPLWAAVLASLFLMAVYAGLYAIPWGLNDEALIDSWLEVHHHVKRQNHFPHEPARRAHHEGFDTAPPELSEAACALTDCERLAAPGGDPGPGRLLEWSDGRAHVGSRVNQPKAAEPG